MREARIASILLFGQLGRGEGAAGFLERPSLQPLSGAAERKVSPRSNNRIGIAVFLAAPASDFVTGAAIPVDGGFSASG
jgi:hypothetical protein